MIPSLSSWQKPTPRQPFICKPFYASRSWHISRVNASATDSPSWLANPAIAQRELLRRYHLCNNTEELLAIVTESKGVLESSVPTTLDLFCYTGKVAGRLVARPHSCQGPHDRDMRPTNPCSHDVALVHRLSLRCYLS